MTTITICVGTSCYMKGSHHVIDRFDQLIRQHGLENEIEMTAAFCMGRCQGNIGTTIDGREITDLTEDTVDLVFKREILKEPVAAV